VLYDVRSLVLACASYALRQERPATHVIHFQVYRPQSYFFELVVLMRRLAVIVVDAALVTETWRLKQCVRFYLLTV
jgi:hypothetical protein